MEKSYLIALILSTLAGLSTVLGGFVTFFIKENSLKFLSFGLGLSAGVMLFISLVDLYPESCEMIKNQMGESFLFLSVIFFAIGILLAVLIDYFIPDHLQGQMFTKQLGANEKHEDSTDCKEDENAIISIGKIKKAGILTAIVVAIHNLPEGLATFTSALTDLEIAIPIVFAIAIHNIPEGVAVSVPIYHSTGSRRKAFWYSFLSGMAEPIGALIGILFLIPFWTPSINALLLALVSGIMVYISFDELLPSTEKYGHHHWGITGVISGMAIMAVSLLLI